MSGLILPDGSQQTTMQTMKLPLRHNVDPAQDDAITVVLPTVTDAASLQMDTVAKLMTYVLNELIEQRLLLARLLELAEARERRAERNERRPPTIRLK